MMRFILTFFLTVVCFFESFSQIEFKAEITKSKLGLNETFYLGYTVSVEGKELSEDIDKENITFPSLENFEIISGLNQRKVTSFVDKKRTETYTFFYELKPLKKGKFNIESASITIDGKTYSSNSLQIKVGKAINLKDKYLIDIDKDIHLVAEIDKTNPYQKEPFNLFYKIYYKEGLLFNGEINVLEEASFENFYKKNINVTASKPVKTTYKGEEYLCFTTRAHYLIPKESGMLTLEPFTVDVGIKVPTKDKDLFGEMKYETITKTLSSNEIKLEVSPFPKKNKPSDFSEILGSFNIEVLPNKTELSKNETFEIEVKAVGYGNLVLFTIPRLEFSEGIEVLETKVNQPEISALDKGFVMSQKYILKGKKEGKQEIKSINLNYFDTEEKMYKSLKTDSITITVKADETIEK